MAKVKSSELPHYELLYLVSNKYSEDEVKPIKEKVGKLITDNGGKITYQEDWGKKRLAYTIEHFNHGYYQLIEFDMPGENLIKLSTALRLSKEILRNQVVKKHVKTEEEIKSEKVIAKKIAQRKEEVIKDTDSSKAELEDINLDEKLDKILETDDLL
ncbi:MAG: 30S ribosomal protein S6 [bacterium]